MNEKQSSDLEVQQHANSQDHPDGQTEDEHGEDHSPQTHLNDGLMTTPIVDVPRL